jgi:hypothetical protein
MGINTAGGSRLFIGSSVSTIQPPPLLAAYETDVWVEVEEVEDLGQFGDESAAVNFTALKDGRVQKLKGPRDAGTIAIVCGHLPGDLGQIAMTAAEAQPFNYNFKVMLSDELEISGNPGIRYFSGMVMSQRLNVGNVSNVVKQNFNVAINTPVLVVDPT